MVSEYERMIRKRHSEAYRDWDPMTGTLRTVSDARRRSNRRKTSNAYDDDSDFDANEESYDDYLKGKARERRLEREERNDEKLRQIAKERYNLRPGQLDPHLIDNITKEIQAGVRANYNRKAFFAEKTRLAEERQTLAKNIGLKDVLEDRLATVINDADTLEVMMNKTYDYHNKNMYANKLTAKREKIKEIRRKLAELDIKKTPVRNLAQWPEW